jgi:glutamate-5-semialdehyde dehydrogenase
MVEVPVKLYMERVLKAAYQAVRPMAQFSTVAKNKLLVTVADRFAEQEEAIFELNERDVKAVGKSFEGEKDRMKEAVDRVRLKTDDLKQMCEDLRRIADLPDPVGEVTSMQQRPNGMQVSRVRAPIGVIGVISEVRKRVRVPGRTGVAANDDQAGGSVEGCCKRCRHPGGWPDFH